jgi:hypothetical protein
LSCFQAESVSRRLGVPVLIHPQPKPGCSKDIIAYFAGDLPLHSLSDPKRVRLLSREAESEIYNAVANDFEEKWKAGETLLGRRVSSTRSIDWKGKGKARETAPAIETSQDVPLRILVVGDRLATDVLLARRITKHLASSSDLSRPLDDLPPALSIVTTRLFKTGDVRILRWLESRWARIGDKPSVVDRGLRAGWQTFLLSQSLEAKDDGLGVTVVQAKPSRLRRLILFIRGIPSGINRLRRWRPPTTRQIMAQTQAVLVRNVKQAGPVAVRGLRTGLGVVGDRARSLLSARRNRTYSTIGRRRAFGTLGGMRLDSKHDLIMEPFREAERRPDRSYQQFPDDADYTQFSPSLDRVPMRGPRSVMVDHLESLGDKEITSVLEEVLTVRAENPHMEHWDMGLISVILSIRSRTTYDQVLRSIPPRSMAALITSLLGMGAIHLSQLILHDLAIRPKITDDVKMAILKACSSESNAVQGLDRSYLTKLVATVADSQLGLIDHPREQTGLVAQEGDNHVARLQALLEGYLLERGTIKSDASRIYKILYTYTAENIGLGLANTLVHRDRERRAKWLVYRVVASLLDRGEVIHALKICKLLGQAEWFDLSVFADRQMGGQLFSESTGLLVWCGLIRACNDLQWLDRAWGMVPAAKKIGKKLAGTDNIALRAWSETIDLLIVATSASPGKSQMEMLKSLLVGPPLQQAGLTLSHAVINGFYDSLEQVHMPTVWSVYRKLRTQGYPPPRDTCLLELHAFLASESKTQKSVETLIQDVEAHPGTLSPVHLPRFMVYLARSRSRESARRFYEEAARDGNALVRQRVLQNPWVMYALVRAFGGEKTATNVRCYDRGFAKTVIQTFITSSPPLGDLTPTTVGLLARAFVVVGAPNSAEKLLKHTFPATIPEPPSISSAESIKREQFVDAFTRGDAEAIPVFADYLSRQGITLSYRHRNAVRKAMQRHQTKKSGAKERAQES